MPDFNDNELVITVVPPPVVRVLVDQEESDIKLITVGIQGPTGAQGVAGTSAANVTAIAGVNIGLGDVVVLNGGVLILADPTNSAQVSLPIGIATSSGTTGNSVSFVTGGQATGLTGLTTGTTYWVGLGGALSTAPTPMGATWIRLLGSALSSSVLVLDKGTAFLL